MLLFVLWLYLGALASIFLLRGLFHWEPMAGWLDGHPYPLGVGEPWNSMAVTFLVCLTACVFGFFAIWNLLIAPRFRKQT